MTGRELILYILSNNLENEPIFNNNKFIGLMTVDEAAIKMGVGGYTVRAWFKQGKLDGIYIGDTIYIAGNCVRPSVNEV